MYRRLIAAVIAAWTTTSVISAEVPEAGERDVRVRYVSYKKDEVTVISVKRGTVTRVILGDDEKIAVAGSGFPSDCGKAELEWCIRADKDTNQIWVKPKDGASANNLELRTDKRDYSFEFKLVNEGEGSKKRSKLVTSEPMYRVIFRYPLQAPPMSAFMAMNAANSNLNEKGLLDQRLDDAKPEPKNWNYSMQVMEGGEDIAPSMVFDDGRFTYFKFPENREIPTLYYIAPSGEESRINFHMEGDLAVVQRMGRRFVLRLGQAVVGVWNDSFDANGVAPKDGTTVEGVTRVLR